MADAERFDPRQLAARVLGLLEPELATAGYELVDVRVFRGGGRLQLRIYVDLPEGGITLDQCARAARTAGMLLEEADPVPGRYVIEVSSPGIRRPLRTADHFRAVVGQKIDLKGRDGRVRGLLTALADDGLHVEREAADEEGQTVVIVPLSEIREANLDPEFDAQAIINADRRQRKEARRAERAQRPEKGRKRRKKGGSPVGKAADDGDAGGVADDD